jgi:hypothetical protein
MDNKTIIQKEYESLKGQFVLSHDRVYRLIGLSEDQWDYYYVLYDGRKITFATCVGRITPLKGFIRNYDYNEMIRLAKLNHYDQPTVYDTNEDMTEFNKKHKEEVTTTEDDMKFISGPFWDLN